MNFNGLPGSEEGSFPKMLNSRQENAQRSLVHYSELENILGCILVWLMLSPESPPPNLFPPNFSLSKVWAGKGADVTEAWCYGGTALVQDSMLDMLESSREENTNQVELSSLYSRRLGRACYYSRRPASALTSLPHAVRKAGDNVSRWA